MTHCLCIFTARRTHGALTALLAVVLVAAACGLASCNIVGGATYLIAGPEKVPALYELDPKKKTVVLIDDRIPVVNSRVNRVRIGVAAERVLLDDAKIEVVISSQDMLALAEREKGSQPRGVVELGEEVGAEVVISALMVSFSLTPDGQTYQPAAVVQVKVMDVAKKEKLWPAPPQRNYVLSVSAPQRQGNPPKTLSEVEAAYASLADRVGLAIAHLFVKHDQRKQDGRIDD
ncbi:MAG: hypothetical protein AB7G11_10545 [Phycisphaerales bacterium]